MIYISQFEYNRIISCSGDRTITIWTITQTSYQCDYRIQRAHNEWIYKVIPLTNNEIASCSADLTIKIWNSNTSSLITILKGHTHIVKSIIKLKNKKILVSVSKDDTLRKWNLSSYKCVTIIQNVNCFSCNGLLEFDINKVIVGGKYKITMVNLDKDFIEQVYSSVNLEYFNSFMILRDGNILCGGENGMTCIYNIKTNTASFKKDRIHNSLINDLLRIDKYTFASCSNEITIWEYYDITLYFFLFLL